MRPRPAHDHPQYREYLKSDIWRGRRSCALYKAGYKCRKCGADDVVLQVHHIHYDHLYNEPQCDLVVLCDSCHLFAHDPATSAEFEEKYLTEAQKKDLEKRRRYWKEQEEKGKPTRRRANFKKIRRGGAKPMWNAAYRRACELRAAGEKAYYERVRLRREREQ